MTGEDERLEGYSQDWDSFIRSMKQWKKEADNLRAALLAELEAVKWENRQLLVDVECYKQQACSEERYSMGYEDGLKEYAQRADLEEGEMIERVARWAYEEVAKRMGAVTRENYPFWSGLLDSQRAAWLESARNAIKGD